MDSLVAYLVAAMTAWVPIRAHNASESPSDTLARYKSIAGDAAQIAFDESETPVFSGPLAREQTALLMLSVASVESLYRKNVDDGTERGDGGRSYCLMQIFVGKGKTREGWTGRDLVEDRKLCFRAGLHFIHDSLRDCGKVPWIDRLSEYVTGRCYPHARVSRQRMMPAHAWWLTHPLPAVSSNES